MNRFDAQVLDVARRHGTMAAADWSGLSRDQVLRLRRTHDSCTRGRGHPTRAEVEAAKPRHSCPCPRCDDWRDERASERQRLAASMTHLVGTPEEWRLAAACLGEPPDVFFPSSGESTVESLAICARCTVREPCLAYALSTQASGHEIGIFGGTTGRDRRRMRGQQATRGGAA